MGRNDSTLLESGTFSKKFASPMAKLEAETSVITRTNLSIAAAQLRATLPENRIQPINSYRDQESRFKHF